MLLYVQRWSTLTGTYSFYLTKVNICASDSSYKQRITSWTNPFFLTRQKNAARCRGSTGLSGYREWSVCSWQRQPASSVWLITRPFYHSDILVPHRWWDMLRKCSSGRQSERRWIQSMGKQYCCLQAVTSLALYITSNPIRNLDVWALSSTLQMSLCSLALLYLVQVNYEVKFKLVTRAKACGLGSTNRGLIWCCHPAGLPTRLASGERPAQGVWVSN